MVLLLPPDTPYEGQLSAVYGDPVPPLEECWAEAEIMRVKLISQGVEGRIIWPRYNTPVQYNRLLSTKDAARLRRVLHQIVWCGKRMRVEDALVITEWHPPTNTIRYRAFGMWMEDIPVWRESP